jgi:hypothetical protein
MPKIAVKLNIQNYTVFDKSHNKDNSDLVTEKKEIIYNKKFDNGHLTNIFHMNTIIMDLRSEQERC